RVQTTADRIGRLGAGHPVVADDLDVNLLHAFAAYPATLDEEEAAFHPFPGCLALRFTRDLPSSDETIAELLHVRGGRRRLDALNLSAIGHSHSPPLLSEWILRPPGRRPVRRVPVPHPGAGCGGPA